QFMRHHRKLTAVILVAGFLMAWATWELSASIRGQVVARIDIARGKYRVLGFGLPPSWQPEYARLLRERYGIEYRPVAGCIVSESLVSYVHGYTLVSMAAANRKFGHDVFEESAEDASRTIHDTDTSIQESASVTVATPSPRLTAENTR